MMFHCANKTITLEISVSCDYFSFEGGKDWKVCPASPQGFDQSNLPGDGEFDQKIFLGGWDLTGF